MSRRSLTTHEDRILTPTPEPWTSLVRISVCNPESGIPKPDLKPFFAVKAVLKQKNLFPERNCRNRKPEPPEPSHEGTVTEPNRTVTVGFYTELVLRPYLFVTVTSEKNCPQANKPKSAVCTQETKKNLVFGHPVHTRTAVWVSTAENIFKILLGETQIFFLESLGWSRRQLCTKIQRTELWPRWKHLFVPVENL